MTNSAETTFILHEIKISPIPLNQIYKNILSGQPFGKKDDFELQKGVELKIRKLEPYELYEMKARQKCDKVVKSVF